MKSSDWVSPGDTYERYAARCRAIGIEPKEFREWLAYELAMATPAGPHVKLDDHDRVVRMSEADQQLQA